MLWEPLILVQFGLQNRGSRVQVLLPLPGRLPGLLMKITLDLTDLVARGELSQAEADRLEALATKDAGSLGANILIGFGIIVVAAGAGALIPTAITAIVIGAILFALGLALILTAGRQWAVLGQICLV